MAHSGVFLVHKWIDVSKNELLYLIGAQKVSPSPSAFVYTSQCAAQCLLIALGSKLYVIAL